MKQDAQTNQTKPINKSIFKLKQTHKKNQIKPTGKTHSLCRFRFRFSRKRELGRLPERTARWREFPTASESDGA